MGAERGGVGSLWEYYRGYTRTAVHAAATAALTGFGLLTYVHPAFAVVAIAAYVLPPLYLYATRDGAEPGGRVGERRDPTDRGSSGKAREPAETVGSTADTDGGRGDEGTAETDDEPGQGSERSEPGGWTVARAPTDATLLDVVDTPSGAHAVGEGGVVLVRSGDGWETALDAGPAAEGNTLRGVDATTDGGAVWVAGDGGALGRIEAGSGRHADHSAPGEITNSWTDVAVAGPAGGEAVVLVDGSGRILRGEYAEGTVDWGDPSKPGGGSSMAAVAFASADLGYACDTNAGVYETRDGGGRYERIGVEGGGAFADVAARAPDAVVAVEADGALRRYDGAVWTRLALGDSLRAVDLRGDDGLACGDGGAIHRLANGTWEPCGTPTSPALHGVCLGDAEGTDDGGPTADVAVGADGTVLERRR